MAEFSQKKIFSTMSITQLFQGPIDSHSIFLSILWKTMGPKTEAKILQNVFFCLLRKK